MNENEKLAEFEQVIFAQVQKQADEIISNANDKKEKILHEAKKQAKHEEKIILENDTKKVLAKKQMDVAKAELEATRDVIRRRQELVLKMFDKVSDNLEKFSQSEQYKKYIVEKINNQKDLVGSSKAQLIVRAEDKIVAESIVNELSFQVEIKTSNEIKCGGFMLSLPDKGILVDKTFDSAVKEERQRFICESGLTIEE